MAVKRFQSVSTRLRNMVKQNTVPVKISESEIIVPTDQQAKLKTQIFNNTTPLGISATYTSASYDTMATGENFNCLTGHCVANQTGNLHIEQSGDGTNWERLDTIVLNAGTPVKFNIDVLSRYVRVVIANGATAQTVLRLYTYATFK